VKKTSIYLEPELDRALARLARERGITKAEVIRRALADAVGAARRPRITAIGIGEGGPGDVSTNTDKYLAEGFGED
jgi:predicted transcriptional regulator